MTPNTPVTSFIFQNIDDAERDAVVEATEAFATCMVNTSRGATMLGITHLMSALFLDQFSSGDEEGASHTVINMSLLVGEAVGIAAHATPHYQMSTELSSILKDNDITLPE